MANSNSTVDSTAKPIALITGAGTGIGRGIAEKFLSENWSVIAFARRLEPLHELAQLAPDRVLAIQCDVASQKSVDQAVAQVRATKTANFQAPVRALIHNAGIFVREGFEKTSLETWDQMMQVNLLGAVRVTHAFCDDLRKTRGSILNISSTLALRPVALTSAYSASKAAMVNWTESLALELAKDGVRVNCICPGLVDTPIHTFHSQSDDEKLKTFGAMQPLGRLGKPQDVAHAAWSLCGPGSEWITGSVLSVDGGIHL